MSSGTYGGLAPWPKRYGGGKRRLEHILEALVDSSQREIGLDTSQGGNVWIEEMATARVIDGQFSASARAANEFVPSKTQSMLARWERIFGITQPAATPIARRAALTFAWQAFGKNPTSGQIADDLTVLGTTPDGMSTAFVAVSYTTSVTGTSYYPGGPTPNPYTATGATVVGSLVDWWSSIYHLAIQVQQPAGMTGPIFSGLVAAMSSYLDGMLPAWCTFSFYQLAHAGGVEGFFLDEPNLDVEAF